METRCLAAPETLSKCCAEMPLRAWNFPSLLAETLLARWLNAERKSKTSKLAIKSGELSHRTETAAMPSSPWSQLVTYIFTILAVQNNIVFACRSQKHPRTQVRCWQVAYPTLGLQLGLPFGRRLPNTSGLKLKCWYWVALVELDHWQYKCSRLGGAR